MSEFKPEVQELITIIPTTDKKEIHISHIVNKGSEYIDIRTYYQGKMDLKGVINMLPGKGIWIPIDSADEVATQILGFTSICQVSTGEENEY